MEEFGQIRNAESLYAFLTSKGGNHISYYHYTDKEALQGIVDSKTIWLSRADELNDLAECNGMTDAEKKRTYIASFTFGTTESVAMWMMYSKNYKDAVRICFPKRMITRLKTQLSQELVVWSTDLHNSYPVEKFYFSDIAYSHNMFFEHHSGKLLNGYSEEYKGYLIPALRQSEELRGLIKSAPWFYEKEVRLIVILKNEQKKLNRIAVKLPDMMEDISLTLGPNTDTSVLPELKFKESSLKGQLSCKFYERFC